MQPKILGPNQKFFANLFIKFLPQVFIKIIKYFLQSKTLGILSTLSPKVALVGAGSCNNPLKLVLNGI